MTLSPTKIHDESTGSRQARVGLGAPVDIDALHQRISELGQRNLNVQRQLDERDDDYG